MSRLHEIAELLTDNRMNLAAAELSLWQAERDAEARALTFVPEKGWPGSNEQARKDARALALASDATMKVISGQIEAAHGSTVRLQAEIAGLEDERRALEWSIRSQLVDTLSRRGVNGDGHGPPETAAFDDLADEVPF